MDYQALRVFSNEMSKLAAEKQAWLQHVLTAPISIFSREKGRAAREAVGEFLDRAADSWANALTTPLPHTPDIFPKGVRDRLRSDSIKKLIADHPLSTVTLLPPGGTYLWTPSYVTLNSALKRLAGDKPRISARTALRDLILGPRTPPIG